MSLWKRTYWVVFVSNLLTAVGMMSFLPFFPSILEDMGVVDLERRMVWTGVLFGAAPLAASFMGPLWGSIGDRHGRKLMVIRSMASISLFAALMAHADTPWMLLALRIGQGMFSGFIAPSVTLVSISTPRERQGRVTGSLQAALPAGMIVGPLVARHIIGWFGIPGLFYFVSTLTGISALLVAFLAHEDASLRLAVERFSPTEALAHTLRDLRQLLANRRIRWALMALFIVQLGVGATSPLLELLVEELAPDGASRIDLTAKLFSGYAVAGLLSTPLWGHVGDRFGHGPCLLFAGLVTAAVLGLHAGAATYAMLFVCRVALGAIAPATNVTAFGVAATESEHDKRGAAFAAVFSARTLAVSVGSFAGGALASQMGISRLFLAVGGAIALLLMLLPRVRRTSSSGGPE